MSVAVKRLSDVIEVLAESPQGATSLEVATSLLMGRQAASRLLEAMVASGLADKDDSTKRYRLGFRMYRWGSAAAARFLPPMFLRYEIAELAEEIQHPVFYGVLDGTHVLTIERSQRRGRSTLTIPDFRRNPWNTTSSGRTLAAFQPPVELEKLLEIPNLPSRKEIEEDFETIRRQGFASSELTQREGYTLAAPILDEAGRATAAIGIGVNKLIVEEREIITRRLIDTANRVSSNAGYSAMLLNA